MEKSLERKEVIKKCGLHCSQESEDARDCGMK